MPSLAGIDAFVQVAETGSFRAAATRMGRSPSAVSKAVARLEEELGTALLIRTTRSVRQTPEGEAFLAAARGALDQLHAGIDQVARTRTAPRGGVKLSIPPVLVEPVVDALPRLLARHPGLELSLSVSDRSVRVIEEGFDVVLRIGELSDSSLVARKLRTSMWITAASPAYLARAGRPQRPDDLAGHSCLVYARPTGGLNPWRFSVGGKDVVARVPVRLRIDHGPMLLDCAVAGMGIIQGFDFMLARAVAAGELVAVLEGFAAAAPPVHALCAPGRQRTPRIRVVLDALQEALGRWHVG